MTFGVKIVNPHSTVILDEEHPIYIAPKGAIVGHRFWLSASSRTTVTAGREKYPRFNDTYTVEFEIRFSTNLTSLHPPLVFIDQKYDPAGVALDAGYPTGFSGPSRIFVEDHVWPSSWLSKLEVVPLGVPGRWSGVTIRYAERIIYSAASWVSENSISANQPHIRDMHQRAIPNLSRHFLAVGYGVEPQPGDFGAIVKNSDGEIVFNTDSNVIHATGASSSWRYAGREQMGEYYERWYLDREAPSLDDYVLAVPKQTYRRYNGEVATVCMTSAIGTPKRLVIGGRSGSPAFTPILFVRPMQPVAYL